MKKITENNLGRPRKNWDSITYEDTDFKKLHRLKRTQKEKLSAIKQKISKADKNIEKLQKSINKIVATKKRIQDQYSTSLTEMDVIKTAIEEKSKIFTKKNNAITLLRSDKYIRGKISYFGQIIWCHIGSYHKKGLVHKRKKIGDMSIQELCDEFRFKAAVKVESSWISNSEY